MPLTHEVPEAPQEAIAVMAEFTRGLHRLVGELADSLASLVEEEIATDVPSVRSQWGRRMLRLPGLLFEQGMTAAEVAKEVGYDEANTHSVLGSLEKAGTLEVLEGVSPKRWRFVVQHRRDQILRASRVVPEGRWTTYGDLAVAVYGSPRLGLPVARVASKNPAFANPHRLLNRHGVISAGWRDDDGNGPEECERRLRAEGVQFEDGHADRRQKMDWEEIKAALDLLDKDATDTKEA